MHARPIAVGLRKTLNNKASCFNGRITEVFNNGVTSLTGPHLFKVPSVALLTRFHCNLKTIELS